MGSIDSDDDDYLAVVEEAHPAPNKALRRLRKGAAGKSSIDPTQASKLDASSKAASRKLKKASPKSLTALKTVCVEKVDKENESNSENSKKRKSAEEILKSFDKDLEKVQSSFGGSLKKTKTVQQSILGLASLDKLKVTSEGVVSVNEGRTEEIRLKDFSDFSDGRLDNEGLAREITKENVPGISDNDLESAEVAQELPLDNHVEGDEDMEGEVAIHDDEEEASTGDQDKDPVDGEEESEEEADEESEEEVDEDDEEAILSLLGKERKAEKEQIEKTLEVLTAKKPSHTDDKEVAGQGSKKKTKMTELEEMHAQSQRLLRETRCVSFKPKQSAGKSISSVLEKIRSRKLQLAQGLEKKPSTFLGEPLTSTSNEDTTVDLIYNDGGVVAVEADNVINQEDQVNKISREETVYVDEERINQEGQETVQRELHDHVVEANNLPSTPESHAEPCRSDLDMKCGLFRSGSAFRAPLEDTQDLFSDSQLSHGEDLEESPAANPLEEVVLGSGLQVDLRLDTETQDDIGSWPEDDSNKENLDPSTRHRGEPSNPATVPAIRALIDDEAEDEDEDPLAVGDEDCLDEGEDLKDLVTSVSDEKAGDVHKRAELHRKWLEQQDAVMTDDILLRLKTGWVPKENRKRGFDFLDEDDDIIINKGKFNDGFEHVDDTQLEPVIHELSEFPDENSQDLEEAKDEGCQVETTMAKPNPEIDEVHESSDDEEAEQKILRQRFLEESEEQEEFILPADDESSREVFGLINKVNVVSHKKSKLGSIETRSLGGTSNSNSGWSSKSSFLRKTVSSSLQPVHRQGSSGSGTRSFIFGRDDSNSSHGLSNGDNQVEMETKENCEPLQDYRKEKSAMMPGGKTGKSHSKSTKASTSGPSLFEILKRQAADLDQALQSKSSNAINKEGVSIFAAFKPLKPNKAPRGA